MAQIIIYVLAIAAAIIPAFLAWRYRGKAASAQTQLENERFVHKQAAEQANADYETLKKNYEAYREIVETSPDTPADIIDRLRREGKIPADS